MDERQDDFALVPLVLQRLPGTAAATLQKLYQHFITTAAIYMACRDQLASFLSRDALANFDQYRDRGVRSNIGQQALRDLEWLQSNNIYLLTIEDARYPQQLREIHYAPPLLMVDGDINVLAENQLAIIGSRKASPSGLEHARNFASELVQCGFVITSGLALGVDSAAHSGAIAGAADTSRSVTVGVVATGLDLCYPSRHEKLMQEIRERGAIVSEFPLGTPPIKENFPRRNRIISGLAQGVLVVEAEEKSGSLITARYALEQNREVFAIPGSIKNPGSRGCHLLIRQGAHLVESADDILRELDHPLAQGTLIMQDNYPVAPGRTEKLAPVIIAAQSRDDLTMEEQELLLHLDDCAVSVDHLSRRAGLPVEEIISLLLGMEIKGWVESAAEGYRRQD